MKTNAKPWIQLPTSSVSIHDRPIVSHRLPNPMLRSYNIPNVNNQQKTLPKARKHRARNPTKESLRKKCPLFFCSPEILVWPCPLWIWAFHSLNYLSSQILCEMCCRWGIETLTSEYVGGLRQNKTWTQIPGWVFRCLINFLYHLADACRNHQESNNIDLVLHMYAHRHTK